MSPIPIDSPHEARDIHNLVESIANLAYLVTHTENAAERQKYLADALELTEVLRKTLSALA